MTTLITETLLPALAGGWIEGYTQALDSIEEGNVVIEENFMYRPPMGDLELDEGIAKCAIYKKMAGLAAASIYATVAGGCVGFIAGEKAGAITGSIMGGFAIAKGCTYLSPDQIIAGAFLSVFASREERVIAEVVVQGSMQLRQNRLAEQT